MMDTIRENKRAAILLLGALIALILAGVYYLYILPLEAENDAKRNANNLVQAEIAILQEQSGDGVIETPLEDNPYELMKKVPKGRELDKIIRTMEEIEMITGTRIGGISFNVYDGLGSEGFTQEEEEEVVNEEPEEQAEDTATDPETSEPGDPSQEAREDAEEEPAPVSTISVADLPMELKMITLSLDTVTANSEEALLQIIQEIEQLERVYRIDTIDLGLPKEDQLADPEAEVLYTAQITLTTFYYSE